MAAFIVFGFIAAMLAGLQLGSVIPIVLGVVWLLFAPQILMGNQFDPR